MKIADITSQGHEATLIRRLRAGDGAAMDEFYTTYKSKLYLLILGRVGGDRNAAEDLVQEVFLAALSSLDNFRSESSFYTWLRSIAVHKVNDFYRRQAREPEHEISSPDFPGTTLEQVRDEGTTASANMESEEVRRSIHDALLSLPRDYRRVLVLKYLHEMPVLEISRLMDRSPKSVEGLLTRARKAMRDGLETADHETAAAVRR